DGQLVWSEPLYPALFTAADAPGGVIAGTAFLPWRMADDGRGHGFLTVTITSFDGRQGRHFLLAFQLATGALLWKLERSGIFVEGPVLGEVGNLYLGTAA